MSFIPQIICRNCGKKFSSIRGRCPACGARHVKQTMRTAPAASAGGTQAAATAAGNARWQLIFGGILVAAVIVAVIILITASLDPAVSGNDPVETPPLVDITSPPPPTPTPTPTPSPTIPVTSVTITYGGDTVTEFTQRTDWAATPLKAEVYPLEALSTAKVTWRSSDTSVATVDETGLVTGVGPGQCNIIAECGGITASCLVRVPS